MNDPQFSHLTFPDWPEVWGYVPVTMGFGDIATHGIWLYDVYKWKRDYYGEDAVRMYYGDRVVYEKPIPSQT